MNEAHGVRDFRSQPRVIGLTLRGVCVPLDPGSSRGEEADRDSIDVRHQQQAHIGA